MKNKILFLLFIMIPVCLLVWFAFRAQTNEQLATQQQYQNLAHSQLKRVDEKIMNYFQQLESTLISERQTLEQELLNTVEYTQKIRQILKYSPYILNIYIEDSDKNTIYPSMSQALSGKEHSFLSNIQAIINNRSLFNLQNKLEQSSAQKSFNVISRNVAEKQNIIQSQDKSSALQSGWIAWYLNRNLHHLFWFKDAQNRLYLLSLDRVRILSELVTLLPDSSPEMSSEKEGLARFSSTSFSSTRYRQSLKDVTIKLRNSNNEVIYEWGDYPVTDNKSIDIMLSYPLSSWKLSWYSKQLSQTSFQQQWSLLIIALSASVLMMIILFLIYREYNRKIQQAQQKVNFVSQVSHELKTPLTNIRMYAELLESKIDLLNCSLEEQALLPETTKEPSKEITKAQHFLSVILNETLRLSRLIENVLSFSKVQKQTFKVNKSRSVVDDCIDNVLLSFMPVFEQKKLVVNFTKEAGKVVFFDVQILEQILNNLLSNIDKYASKGGKIDIRSHQTDNAIRIELRDYGPGIAKKEQDKIFNPFYRTQSKITEGVSGTGIGLTISQQLATLHGGQLTYKNVSQGACFVIQIMTSSTKESE